MLVRRSWWKRRRREERGEGARKGIVSGDKTCFRFWCILVY